MNTQTPNRTKPAEALQAAQAAHDEAARSLMRLASDHLRASILLQQRIARLPATPIRGRIR